MMEEDYDEEDAEFWKENEKIKRGDDEDGN